MKKRKRTGIKWGLLFLYIGILTVGVASWLLPIFGLVAWFRA